MPERIALVTDSTCDMTREEREAAGIHMVPLSVLFGEEEFADGVDLTIDQFYEKLEKDDNYPTTASPSTGRFLELYQQLQQQGYTHILGVHLSRKFSGTLQAAAVAATMVPSMTIKLIDSKVTGRVLGLLAEYISGLIKQGLPFAEVVEKTEQQVPHCGLFFSMDSLDALYRGGRIGKAKALIGKYLGIRPILTMKDGEILVLKNTNSVDAACTAMAEYASEHVKKFGLIQKAVILTAALPHYGPMLQHVIDKTDKSFGQLDQVRIGGVVGSHVGPNAWGIMLI